MSATEDAFAASHRARRAGRASRPARPRCGRHGGLARWAGHRQVTGAYLSQLARGRGGRLATFDKGLAVTHPDVTELVPLG